MTTLPRIDLSQFSRGQLKQLADDVGEELEQREAEDRRALEGKLRALVEEAGFDPDDMRFATASKRKARKSSTTDGADHD